MFNIKQALQDKIIIQPLLKQINERRNSDLVQLNRDVSNYDRWLIDSQRNVKRYEEQREAAIKRLKEAKDNSWNTESLVASINQLSRHKYVDFAYLTQDMKLIVQTKPLFRYDGIEEKQMIDIVGRYAFCIQFPNGNDIHRVTCLVHPLDFISQNFRHPNIMSDIDKNPCWGSNFNPIEKMLLSGEFYSAIDNIIVFFATFPHPAGHSPLYWLIWLNERQLAFEPNPWIKEKAIYSIGRVREAKPKKFPIIRHETMLVGKQNVTMKDLRFRLQM